MSCDAFYEFLATQCEELVQTGYYKTERIITTPQQAHIKVADGKSVINFCANNYLGLANHPALIEAAKQSYDQWGFGLASVRFICGTQTLHKQLEQRLSQFLRTEDTLLYSSCFDANGGLFEAVLSEEDAVISDSLNHASIIDGIRLCKAKRFRYENNRMDDLEAKLKEASSARFRLIATDGVFSMDGIIANLPTICKLADHYQALVMVDDCHATGFLGQKGRGTPEYCGCEDKVDILTGTLGKALGGASGGYVSGKKKLIDWLRQRSRPYLFSNTLTPSLAAAAMCALDLVEKGDELRQKLHDNASYFRSRMNAFGFSIVAGEHPIVPVLLGEADVAQTFASRLLDRGIYVIGFSYPVVPKGKARIRVQLSAAHTREDIDQCLEAFNEVGKELKIVGA